LPASGRPAGAPSKLYLTVTSARDDDGTRIGYTLVFTDHSGEEERIRNAAIRTILDNVPYGLFVLDEAGNMKSGYSDSCRAIFAARAEGDLEGRELVEILGLPERAANHFRACFQQVFDDIMPEEVSLDQIPARVTIDARTYSLQGSVIRGDQGEVGGVLFTMLDITGLVAAERQAELHRATVQVLRYRASFEAFVRDLDAALRDLSRTAASSQAAIRFALHTAKGAFGQFMLADLASRIHSIEDQETIDGETLLSLRDEVRALVAQNRDVWGLDLDATDRVLSVPESLLCQLEQEAQRTDDPRALRRLVSRAVARIREERAAEILGPIVEATQQLAERRGKRVLVVVRGCDVPISRRHAPVLSSLVHLARNAVDHGIEPEDERGDKPPVATITIEVRREGELLLIDVSDDGRGIDPERLVERARTMGMLTEEQARALSRDERYALLFASGLSTASDVTDISGRGVGAGAVKDAVERLDGRVFVSAEVGKGTRFTLHVPGDIALRASDAPPARVLRASQPPG
jgi:two-component system chemotaxis sensor kinase CheA